MKVLVTGVNGQLGHDVMNELNNRGHVAIGSGTTDSYSGIKDNSAVNEMNYIKMDITDADMVDAVVQDIKPDAVIHCAAWTDVDAAEDSDKQELVYSINVNGTRNIAHACQAVDAKLLYLSTDYVFNGQGELPWSPDDKTFEPLNYYGVTKLGGENAVAELMDKFFIVRIAWVFGLNGKNFVKTMLNLSDKFDTIRVVNDQIGTPTYTYDLARLLVDMIETEKYGYYHATNEGGYISWYEFAEEIFRQAGKQVAVIPVSTKEYGESIARRPYNSRLNKDKLDLMGFERLPEWKDALHRYLIEIESLR